MTDFINELGKHLEHVIGSSRMTAATENWGRPEVMTRALAKAERYYASSQVTGGGDGQSIAEAILHFRNSRYLGGYRETKYVCIGASQEFSGWCLLQDHELREMLLERSGMGSDAQQLKYFEFLLCSYWSFPRDDKETSAATRIGWIRLRDWLNERRRYLDRSVKTKPLWFLTLNDHANLLADHPCKRYGEELLQGASAVLNEVFDKLAVGSDSWLRDEAVYAQIQAGTELVDIRFLACLPRLIDTASGRTRFRVSRSISIRGLALLVSRCAACDSTPEHISLRDATIAFIGNPWLHRAAWDAYVLDEAGRPDDRAREMVNGWLKVRLIKDFFGLLSEDRSADDRRLNYWLGFEPFIQHMWFALGADAVSDPRKEYVEIRQRASGRILNLVGATPTFNNAFLMHLGDYLVIEFGTAGNACYVYRYDRLPSRIKMRLNTTKSGVLVDIALLKAQGRVARLLHNGSWEPSFDAALCPLFGFVPSMVAHQPITRRTVSRKDSSEKSGAPTQGEPHSTTNHISSFSRLEFERFRYRHGLDVDDLGPKGGCLWVRTDTANALVNERLRNWGFTYRPAMGWWKE